MKVKICSTMCRYGCIADIYPCVREYDFDNGYIEINTLDEVQTLVEAVRNPIIIHAPNWLYDDEYFTFEIYDDFRE